MDFDIIVIGFGKAGKTLAARAANLNKKVALIEKSPQMYGGTCINIGCIPTKKLVSLGREAKFFADKNSFYKSAMKAKDSLIGALRAKNYAMLNDNANITVFDGFAKFKDQNSVMVADTELRAPTIIINTGATEKMPSFSGERLYSSTGLLELKTLPEKLVVIGCGFIGLEFASMYANFGSKVSVLARSEEFLPNLDEDARASIKEALSAQGIEIILNSVATSLDDKTLTYNQNGEIKTIEADAFLAAFGRVPATDGLNLGAAGVELGACGEILVNEYLQSSVPHIYAVGDCKGGPEFTYISLDDSRIVFEHLFGAKTRSTKNRSAWATVTFMDTELAIISKGDLSGDLQTAKILLSSVPMAKVLGHDTGFMKAFVDKNSGEIVRVILHCKNAGELINIFALAMEHNIKASEFKRQIWTHPSLSEAFNDLFMQF